MLSAFFISVLDTISPRHDAIHRSAPCRGVVFTAILLYLLFLRIRCDHRSDGGRVIRVLRNADLHIPQALEILDDLAALEEFSQSADQDTLFDAGAHR